MRSSAMLIPLLGFGRLNRHRRRGSPAHRRRGELEQRSDVGEDRSRFRGEPRPGGERRREDVRGER